MTTNETRNAINALIKEAARLVDQAEGGFWRRRADRHQQEDRAVRLERQRDDVQAKAESLVAQAIDVSNTLAAAGIGAMPIPEAVRHLVEQRDFWRGSADRWRDAEARLADERQAHQRTLTKLETALRVCTWRANDEGGWDTGCDQRWEFIDDGPTENGVQYCPFCGGCLRVAS